MNWKSKDRTRKSEDMSTKRKELTSKRIHITKRRHEHYEAKTIDKDDDKSGSVKNIEDDDQFLSIKKDLELSKVLKDPKCPGEYQHVWICDKCDKMQINADNMSEHKGREHVTIAT